MAETLQTQAFGSYQIGLMTLPIFVVQFVKTNSSNQEDKKYLEAGSILIKKIPMSSKQKIIKEFKAA